MRRARDVDMSPEAIDRRLRELGQLHKLWMSLREARSIGRAEDLKAQSKKAPKPDAEGPSRHEG
jgi:hypothetical protein